MPSSSIAERALELALPIAEKLGLEIWDICFVKEGSEYYLRIIIDKPGGINITDCENMSREIDPLLDEYDFIDKQYCLEVTSPGIGRELKRKEHFEKMAGEDIVISLYKAVNGIKTYTGTLLGCGENGDVSISSNGNIFSFAKKDISKVRLDEEI